MNGRISRLHHKMHLCAEAILDLLDVHAHCRRPMDRGVDRSRFPSILCEDSLFFCFDTMYHAALQFEIVPSLLEAIMSVGHVERLHHEPGMSKFA